MSSNRIDDFMSKSPHCVNLITSAAEAKRLMAHYKLRHLPVVYQHKVVGVISERQLHNLNDYSQNAIVLVKDLMIKDPFIVKTGTPLAQVAHIMADKKYGCTIIHNGRGEIIGIFTTTDGMKILSLLLQNPNFVHRLNRIDDVIDYDQIAALSG